MYTNYPHISDLNFAVLVDASTPTPTVKFTNMSTGTNLAACKWIFDVILPNGMRSHLSDFDTPDVTGAWSTYDLPETLQLVMGSLVWSGAPYQFIVRVQDGEGAEFNLIKAEDICRPNGNQPGSIFGKAHIDLLVKCDTAKLYAEDRTNYAYKKQIQPSIVMQKRLTIIYPADEQGQFPTPFVVNDFSNALIPISFSAPGYQAIVESIMRYDLDDNISIILKYKFREEFAVQCNIDLCKITCEYEALALKAVGSCDKELSDKLLLINAKINMALIGKMQPLCKIDVGKIVEEIKEIGGFDCDCNCGNGIVPMANIPGSSSADCNAVSQCIDNLFNQLDPKCLATLVEWQSLGLLGKMQLIINAASESKCAPCVAPTEISFNVLTKTLRWYSAGISNLWSVFYKKSSSPSFILFTSPLPQYIGNGYWEVDMSSVSYEAAAEYIFGVAANCGSSQSSILTSGAIIVNGCTPVSFTPETLPNAQAGVLYTESIPLSGTSPFNLTDITKPGWMTIAVVGTNIQITGTPTGGDVGAGIPIAFTINNACGSQDHSQTIQVAASCTAVSFVEPTLPDATTGQSYLVNIALSGTGGFYLTGVTKPSWMNINVVGTNLVISGTPLAPDAGDGISVQFTVNNACGNQSLTQAIDVDVACTAVSFVEPTLPDGVAGQPYNQFIALSGTASFYLTGVTKPSWMTISIIGSTVQLSGTPGVGNVGTDIAVAFNVNNACGNQVLSQTISISAACTPVSFVDEAIPDGIVGEAYNKSFALSGTGPFSLTGITKPAWMTIAIVGSTAVLSGTPTPGSDGTNINVAFTVNNACGNQSLAQTIDVTVECTGVTFMDPDLPAGEIGNAYSQSIPLFGTGPFSLTGITKPAWMTIAIVGSTINITGTPGMGDAGASFTVAFTANNACGDQSFTQNIPVGVMGTALNKPCGTYNILDIQFGGVQVTLLNGATFPLVPDPVAYSFLILNPANAGMLYVETNVSVPEIAIEVVDSNANAFCNDSTASPSFTPFNVNNDGNITIALDCGACS